MPSKYIISDHQAPHFITMTIIEWVDALSRPDYKEIIIENLKYCQINKGLIIYAFVIMSNHIHLIVSVKDGYNLSHLLRDFKGYTSKKLYENIESNPKESRKHWILELFNRAGKSNWNNKNFQIWQQNNHPIQLSDNKMTEERLEYIHYNPVKAGIVYEPEHYIYSSAINYTGRKGILDVYMIQ